MRQPLRNKRVLLTLGPTREYLDRVRYLSNASSGKMGLAIAEECRSRGAKVFLVSGPGVSVPPIYSSESVVSAREMLSSVKEHFHRSDIFIACAAVADFRPAKTFAGKLPKAMHARKIPLVLNPDILAEMGRRKKDRVCVGFALEDSAGKAEFKKAFLKMKKKNCDLMVFNTAESMESESIQASLLFKDGEEIRNLGKVTKKECARRLCDAIEGKHE